MQGSPEIDGIGRGAVRTSSGGSGSRLIVTVVESAGSLAKLFAMKDNDPKPSSTQLLRGSK
jgi:hypothetical protein